MILGIVYTIFNYLDIITTYIALKNPNTSELNPLFKNIGSTKSYTKLGIAKTIHNIYMIFISLLNIEIINIFLFVMNVIIIIVVINNFICIVCN